jgi:hypothetical protein
VTLGQLNRSNEAIAAYDELLSKLAAPAFSGLRLTPTGWWRGCAAGTIPGVSQV